MRTIAFIVACCMAACPAAVTAGDAGLAVTGVRFFSYPGFTRIVFEAEAAAPYVLTRSGDGRSLYFSSYGGPFSLKAAQLPVVNDGVVKGLEFRQDGGHRAVIILLAPGAGESKDFVLRGPDRIVVDIQRGAAASQPPAATARPPLVVLDPGHGGRDPGLLLAGGPEKVQVLELAHAVRRALRRAGRKMVVVLTREHDVAAGPDERAAAANAAEAAVFVSLHLAPGSEKSRVFILDPDEGRSVTGAVPGTDDFLGFDAVSEQQHATWGSQQAAFAQASGRLGRVMARTLTGRDTAEPDQAPLLLLRSVAAAAVLVEVGAGQNRGQAAEAIARGIEQYVGEK